jgi:hypothetical protein
VEISPEDPSIDLNIEELVNAFWSKLAAELGMCEVYS